MSKSPNHQVSRIIRPFATTFFQVNGRLPKTSEVMDAFGGQLPAKNYDAVRKALKRMESAGPEKMAPAVKNLSEKVAKSALPKETSHRPKTLQGRIDAVREMLSTLEEQSSEGGFVDAHAYDKLTRLERQLEEWLKKDAESALNHHASEVAPPSIEAILDRYRKRTKQGLNKGGPRDENQSNVIG